MSCHFKYCEPQTLAFLLLISYCYLQRLQDEPKVIQRTDKGTEVRGRQTTKRQDSARSVNSHQSQP